MEGKGDHLSLILSFHIGGSCTFKGNNTFCINGCDLICRCGISYICIKLICCIQKLQVCLQIQACLLCSVNIKLCLRCFQLCSCINNYLKGYKVTIFGGCNYSSISCLHTLYHTIRYSSNGVIKRAPDNITDITASYLYHVTKVGIIYFTFKNIYNSTFISCFNIDLYRCRSCGIFNNEGKGNSLSVKFCLNFS